MRKSIVALGLVLAVFLCSTAYAGSPWTEKKTYAEQVPEKLSFGFRNMVLGWTELFNQPQKSGWAHIGSGLCKGVSNFLVYTAGGAIDFATFLVPQIDIPLPNNGISF